MTLQSEHHFSRSACPVEQLEWFVNGTLSAQERALVEAHLSTCAVCRTEAAAWTELRLALGEVSAATPEPRADLLLLLEQRLDLVAESPREFWLGHLLRVCWLMLSVCGEHFFAQARLLRRDLFWLPLFIVPLAASIVYLPSPWREVPGSAALLAALLTALGMAFLYGQKLDPAREIALVTRTSPRLVLGIRCCLVFGYDLLLNCGLVLPFLVLHSSVTPAWFLTNWLAPLCCLSAIALLVSILVNSATAVCVCFLLWTLRLLSGIQALLFGGAQPFPQAFWQQRYESFWHQGPLLFALAVLAVGLTFLVLERKERFAR